ncbi:MAG: RNA pyrophosphohydrolase [Campylobacter sp.]|nr:RNA pyrophosphohydrolase [Campylobacter sp.]
MEKKYRPNVAAVILSSKYPFKCEFLVANRIDLDQVWQFPQGGIDEGESPQEALLRELKEEIGTNEVEILDQHPEWISYDFPSGARASKKMYMFDGQTQKYFLVRLKPGAKINLNTQKPEFSKYKFLNFSEVCNEITHFKKPIYMKVLNYFKEKGYI